MPGFAVRGAEKVAAGFLADAAAITAEVAVVVAATAVELLVDIRRRAETGVHPPGQPHIPGTGPGPNRATGEYIVSWEVGRVGARGWMVSTDAPQANRLEYGFHGVDSLGRSYSQRAYPHVGPAADAAEAALNAGVEAVLDRRVGRATGASHG